MSFSVVKIINNIQFDAPRKVEIIGESTWKKEGDCRVEKKNHFSAGEVIFLKK